MWMVAPRKWAPLYCCLLERRAKSCDSKPILSHDINKSIHGQSTIFLYAAGLGDTRVIMGWNSADTLTSATEISMAQNRFSAIVQQIAL